VLRRLGLRSRLVLIGTAGLAAGLAIGGAALVLALSLSLRHALDTSALQTAHDVSALVNTGRLPDPVPVAGAQLVQVVDASGRVRSGSPGVDRLVPLLQPGELARVGAGERLTIDGARAGMDGPLRVLALTAGPASDRMTVIVATPSGTLTRSSAILRDTLLVAYPVFVAVLAALAWRVIGLTLRPVEALRAGAEEITGRRGEGRLPVPPAHDEIHRLAVTLNGMLDQMGFFFVDEDEFAIAPESWEVVTRTERIGEVLDAVIAHVGSCDWTPEGIAFQPVLKALGANVRKTMPALYAVIEGVHRGLPLFDSMCLLGRARTLHRLRSALRRVA